MPGMTRDRENVPTVLPSGALYTPRRRPYTPRVAGAYGRSSTVSEDGAAGVRWMWYIPPAS